MFLCVCLFSSCFSLSSSAVDVNEDLLNRGYVYDGYSYSLPEGVYDPEMSIPSTMLAPEKYYSDFDPKKIPWSDAPSYIQDLIYMSLDSAATSDAAQYKMPFILIRVSSSSYASVYVGYNCGLGYDIHNDRMRICVSNYFFDNSACYMASYNLSDYSVRSDWTKLSTSTWGDFEEPYVLSYTSTLAYPTSSYDFYLYGGNGIRAGNYASVSFPLHSSYEDGECTFVVNNKIGFQSGRFFYNDSNSSIYCQTFLPPTVQQVEQNIQKEQVEQQKEQNKTSKGIWETLKSIPEMIADKFKGLFIPSDGYFDSLTTEFQNYFSERLGVIYELPEALIGILQQFVDFEPLTDGYYIPIPEVVIPIRLEDGTTEDFTILEAQDYKFDFLSEGPIGILYTFYRSFCWLTCILSLMGLALRKYNQITGGGE